VSLVSRPRLELRDYLLAAALVGLALALRLQGLWVGLYGDETWYFHLSRTLGIGREHVVNPFPEGAHVLARPFLYVFTFPAAQLGVTAYRVFNAILSAATVGVTALACRSLGLRRLATFVGCLVVVAHDVTLVFTTRVFPDTPATFFAMLAVWAFLAERPRAMFLACVAATLSKEAFAVVPLALGLLSLERGGRLGLRVRPIGWWAAASGVPLLLCMALSIFVLGGRLQGWSNIQPDTRFLALMGITLASAPLFVVLALVGQGRVLVLALMHPVFYLVWWYVVGRGVNEWYVVGAVPPLAMATAAALDAFPRAAAFAERSRWGRARATLVGGALGVLAANLVLIDPHEPLSHLRSAFELRWIRDPKDTDFSSLPPIVDQLARDHRRDLLLVDCFWAHSFYPFGTLAERVEIVRAVAAGTVGPIHRDADLIPELTPEPLLERVRRADAVVVLNFPQNQWLRTRLAFCQVEHEHPYTLYLDPARCLSAQP
jgi:hypothetical protein